MKTENDALTEYENKRKIEKVENVRSSLFGKKSRLLDSTFENDLFANVENPLRINANRYVNEWETNKENGHSLFLYGSTGIGKSFYGACITTEIIRKSIKSLYTDFKVIYLFMPSLEWASAQERNQTITNLKKADFVFIDELDTGAIPKNAINFYFTIFDTLYTKKTPFVLTTNASPQSMFADKHNDVRFAKIYDRISHQCAKYGFITSKMNARTEIAKREREEYEKHLRKLQMK